MKNRAVRLYTVDLPSFIDGIARIFDFGGFLDDYEPAFGTPAEQDLAALRSDWLAVGQDMRDVMGSYADQEFPSPLEDE